MRVGYTMIIGGVFLSAWNCLQPSPLRADETVTASVPIQFQVVPERDSFEASQGVWLTVSATNVSDDSLTFVWGDYAYEDLFMFEVVRTDGAVTPPPRRRLLPPVEALTERDVVTLAPGESRQRTIVLAMIYGGNVQPFRFVYPGNYLIRPQIRLLQVRPATDGDDYFESQGSPVDVECETIEVSVQAPVPDPTLYFSMTGLVVDSSGDPVSSVEIDVEAQHEEFSGFDGWSWQRVDRVVTDRHGRFAIEGLDRGVARHRLLLHHPVHPVAGHEIPTQINEGIIELDPITLADGHTLHGIVTDDNGVPIVGARITTGIDRERWTNREGRFRDDGYPTAIADLDTPLQLQAWKRGWVEAGPAQVEEMNGEQLLHQVLVPESRQQISGIAKFADGEIAANMDLYVYCEPSDGYPIETATDAAGRFTVDWIAYPGKSNHGLVAVLEKGESHLPRRAWITTFPDLAAGQERVEFTFDASRQLELNVVPSNVLPESTSMTVSVRLQTAGNREQWLFEEHLPSTGGALSWDRLSPGRYSINVSIDRAEHWNWTQEVIISGDGAVPAQCRIELPELQFGSATVNVVTSDGVTPWSGGDLWMDSSFGWGPVSVFNGRAELHNVPAGPIHIEVHTEGYARTHLHGEIMAGETVELGTLKALTLQEGTGLVIGRVLMPGGGPAIGARVDVDGGSYALPPHLGGRQVDGDGLFELRLDPGRQTVNVHVDHVSALAGNQNSLNGRLPMFSQRRLQAAVDVVAGGETQVEIEVPIMTGEIALVGSSINHALLFMPIDDTLSYRDTLTLVFGEGVESGAAFEHLPQGLAQVVVYRPVPPGAFPDATSGGQFMWEHHWVEVTDERAVIELHDAEAGRLRVNLENAGGSSIADYVLKAAPNIDELPLEIKVDRMQRQVQSTGAHVEDGNGVLYLAPGRYDVTVIYQQQTLTAAVEITAGQTTEIDLHIEVE